AEDLYAAMDWLQAPQGEIEKKLAQEHLQDGALVLYDVIAPRQARRFLRGESPRRVRASHPPVSSLAPVAESPEGGEQDRRSVDRASCRP
ncbi:MAG: hypothetical protein ACREXR_02470, partial [Gammaproteobacteria bacterium]